MSIEISEDNEFGEQFIDNAIKFYEDNNRKRIADSLLHVGDITFCIRKSLIPQIFPSQSNLDIFSISNFMRGSGAETSMIPILEYMYKDDNNEYQMDIRFDDVSGHPDFINNTKGIVFELKNTNAQESLTIDSDNLKSYTRQIIYYMLLTNIEDGKVIVQYGLPFEMKYLKSSELGYHHKIQYRNKLNKIPYFFYKIHISKDHELRHKIKSILNDKIRPVMIKAVKDRDLTIIPNLPDKKSGGWKCRNCPFKKICDMVPDRQEDKELRSYLLNEHIDSLIEVKK